jgi:hypothetical protein
MGLDLLFSLKIHMNYICEQKIMKK